MLTGLSVASIIDKLKILGIRNKHFTCLEALQISLLVAEFVVPSKQILFQIVLAHGNASSRHRNETIFGNVFWFPVNHQDPFAVI